MRRPWKTLVLAAGVALMLVAAPPAYAAPPNGDDFAGAVNVPLNTSKTIKNVQNATVQGPPIDVTTCDGDNNSHHSVWFTFTIPEHIATGLLDVETLGSVLDYGTSQAAHVVLSVYTEGSPHTEVDCTTGFYARLTEILVQSGTYYVRLASDVSADLTGPSQYRLTLRLRRVHHLMVNESFENGPLAPDWKVKGAGTPPQIVQSCSISCSVLFNGIAGGKLQQTYKPDKAWLGFKKGDILEADARIASTAIGGADIKLTLQITYTDSTPTTTVSATRQITNPSTIATSFGSVHLVLASKRVKSIKMIVSSRDDDDTFSLTAVDLTMFGYSSVRALPVSPGPGS